MYAELRVSASARKNSLRFDNFDYFAALIHAAMGAGTVRSDLLLAIRAVCKLRDTQSVMSAAGGGPALRVASFGIRHFLFFLLSRQFRGAISARKAFN